MSIIGFDDEQNESPKEERHERTADIRTHRSGGGCVGSAGNAAVAASDALTPKAIHALGARYEAMAQYYAGASSRSRRRRSGPWASATRRWRITTSAPGAVATRPQALRALGERWQAVARYEQQAQLEQARRQAAAFDWADAGIGALAAIGVVALLGLGALGIRSRTARRPASPAAS